MTDLVKYEDRGLTFLRPPETLKEMEAVTHALSYFTDNLPWVWGDCIVYGQQRFGESFSQLIPERAAKTLVNWAYVARSIPRSERTYDLSFSHYAEAAALSSAERQAVLSDAEREGWTVSQLREKIKGKSARSPAEIECPHCRAVLQVREGKAVILALPEDKPPL